MGNDRRQDRRRDIGGSRASDGISFKNTLITAGIILILGISAFFVTIMIYNHNLEKTYSELESTQIGETKVEDNINKDIEEASSNIGKTVEELENNSQQVNAENEETIQVTTGKEEPNTNQNTEASVTKPEKTEENKPKEEGDKKQENIKEPEFIVPVEGEIIKEFASDKLVYSETLKEWVVHTGLDIKAEKTTVVKSAEAGKVTAIKNDPRYGITVIIDHGNGYETRYANLLTAEFVNVGEEVTKGQTIGTVGNTATFEVLDDFHLHFEILKNGEYQNPIFFMDI